jgi:mannosyltransferase
MILLDGIIFSLQKQGGISVYFRTLIEFLSNNDEKTTLLLNDFQYQLTNIDRNSIILKYIESKIFERYRLCRTPNYGKIFHSSYYRKSDKPSIPSVVTVHDFIYERFQRGPRQWVHSAQKNSAIRAAQAVICISESTRQDFLEFVGESPGQKIHVIHNGVSDIFCNLSLEQPITPYVLFVGQRGGYKNFRLAIESLSLLPDLELYCVGGGAIQPDELKGLSLNVARRIRHLGFVTDQELNFLYNRALCLLYPSSYEGFGIPVVEAMRAGCPVVCIDCKAIIEVGRDALTVALEPSPRALAEAILKTAYSDRSGLIKKGLSVGQSYSWSITHSQTLEVYRSLGI